MVTARIESLLKEKIGLDAASVGTATIERAVRERCTDAGCQDAQAYLDLVMNSALEQQKLIEAVVVPESWFFRDRQAFAALADVARQSLRKSPEGVLRVLSLPCSTGEEPYSMVMTLLDAGIPAHRFQVDAVDISTCALDRADAGIYGKNSFRDKDVGYRDDHFVPMGSAYCLNETVRRQVCFRQGNLFDAGIFFGPQMFDVIFSRNVLIYFDRPTQLRAVAILNRLLATTGMLFVGPSETGVLQNQGFVTAKLPFAFAFRKTLAVEPKPGPPQVRSIKPTLVAAADARTTPEVFKPRRRSSPAPAVVDTPRTAELQSWIEEAQQLADQGNLLAAFEYCKQHMSTEAPSAAAFYLLGLLHDAAGRSQQACEQYRKATYLDPGHTEALVHLAAGLRRDGDARGAQLLLDRAARSAAGGK